jgi:hypothetical protein
MIDGQPGARPSGATARVFYVLVVPDPEIAACLDTARLLADSAARWRAHITVRGPYDSEIQTEALARALVGNIVTVFGVGRFAGQAGAQQNTVVLRCDGTRLRVVWDKPDFPYNPHITLYDGPDPAVADAVAEVLGRHRLSLRFVSDRLVSGVTRRRAIWRPRGPLRSGLARADRRQRCAGRLGWSPARPPDATPGPGLRVPSGPRHPHPWSARGPRSRVGAVPGSAHGRRCRGRPSRCRFPRSHRMRERISPRFPRRLLGKQPREQRKTAPRVQKGVRPAGLEPATFGSATRKSAVRVVLFRLARVDSSSEAA